MKPFSTTRHEFDVIQKIIDRAAGMGFRPNRLASTMDIEAVHSNGCPMDLDRWLAADDFNFAHDWAGIARHVDRDICALDGIFTPRFARPMP